MCMGDTPSVVSIHMPLAIQYWELLRMESSKSLSPKRISRDLEAPSLISGYFNRKEKTTSSRTPAAGLRLDRGNGPVEGLERLPTTW